MGARADIQGAFLLAPWPTKVCHYSPRTLIQADRATGTEAWEVDRALYGLRESPAVWSEFRRARLLQADVPWKEGRLMLKPSVVDPEVWMIVYRRDREQDVLTGILVTYVDDVLYLAEADVTEAVHGWLCE